MVLIKELKRARFKVQLVVLTMIHECAVAETNALLRIIQYFHVPPQFRVDSGSWRARVERHGCYIGRPVRQLGKTV